MTSLPAGEIRRGAPSPLAIVTISFLVSIAGGAGAGSAQIPLEDPATIDVSSISASPAPLLPSVTLQPVVTSGLGSPVAIANAGDGTGRLFIVDQNGYIRIWTGTQVLATPFLDIHTIITAGGEQGLLSLAFHPNYASNGYFFVYYTDTTSPTYNIVIARYHVSVGDPNQADPAGVILLPIPHPINSNHNGGQLQFGPDGYLYISTGDGGSGNDPPCNAQNDMLLLGKLLRVDVDQNISTPPYFGIPPTNPFAGSGPPRDRIWDKGLRNPWRFSFDRATGDIYIGDVGQSAREEVDFEPAGGAGYVNYGWKVMEGTLAGGGGTTNCPPGTPPSGDPSYTLPIAEYSHSFGCSITGGYVYRGTQYPQLWGAYLYSDYCSGIIWGAQRDCTGVWSAQQLLDSPYNASSFGQDEAGEVYFADLGGGVYKVTATTSYLAPTMTNMGPTSAIAGDPSFTLTVNGTGFAPASVVRWNGSNRATVLVCPTQLAATILSSDVNSAGTATVTVFNPAPGGGTSSGQTFNINPRFLDVPLGYWAISQIDKLVTNGITAGCGNRIFCPEAPTTRAQMAVFLLRAKNGSSYNPPAATGMVFNDVPISAFAAAWIEALAATGTTAGCGGGNYCPGLAVTRAQMAVFLLRMKNGSTYNPPPATGTIFGDVPATAFAAAWIEALAAAGYTAGCGSGNYCPNAISTRAQMAVFLVATFNLP